MRPEFTFILDAEHNKDFFLSNDLMELFSSRAYQHPAANWKQLYNACIVVPIKPDESKSIDNTIGFLAVDNLKGGFDHASSLPLLQFASWEIYRLFDKIFALHHRNE